MNEVIRETLSEAIAGGLKDPRVGFVTVTGVETSADLRHARVFVSVLGAADERDRTLAGLRSSHGYLQERVATELRLKRTPQLDFVYDDSIDRGMHIEALLRRYAGAEAPEPTPKAAGEATAADGTEGET